MLGPDKPAALNRLGAYFRRRAEKERDWRAAVRTQRLDGINQLARLSDAELIATPGIPNESHQMEMTRQLKVAIEGLTEVTVTAGKSADRASSRILWLNVFLILLRAVATALIADEDRRLAMVTSRPPAAEAEELRTVRSALESRARTIRLFAIYLVQWAPYGRSGDRGVAAGPFQVRDTRGRRVQQSIEF